MHTRVLKPKHGPTLLVRPLRHGDVRTVLAVFERLGAQSRRARFNGPKPCLSAAELRELAPTTAATTPSSPTSRAIRSRSRSHGSCATARRREIAFAVADDYQHRGIGSTLAAELIADARASGIREITALASSDNPAAVALLRRTAKRARRPARGPRALDPRRHRVSGGTFRPWARST